jgi:hypothetical protein
MVPSGGKRTLLRITCRHLTVAHGHMTTAVKRVVPQPVVAGSPALRGSRMGDGRFHRRVFAQGGSAAFRAALGLPLLRERIVRAEMQTPPVPTLCVRARGAYQPRITGTRRTLDGHPGDHRPRHATRTGNQRRPKVQPPVMFGAEGPALGPGASHDVHTLHRPRGHSRTHPVAPVEVQLPQAWTFLQRLRQTHPHARGHGCCI